MPCQNPGNLRFFSAERPLRVRRVSPRRTDGEKRRPLVVGNSRSLSVTDRCVPHDLDVQDRGGVLGAGSPAHVRYARSSPSHVRIAQK